MAKPLGSRSVLGRVAAVDHGSRSWTNSGVWLALLLKQLSPGCTCRSAHRRRCRTPQNSREHRRHGAVHHPARGCARGSKWGDLFEEVGSSQGTVGATVADGPVVLVVVGLDGPALVVRPGPCPGPWLSPRPLVPLVRTVRLTVGSRLAHGTPSQLNSSLKGGRMRPRSPADGCGRPEAGPKARLLQLRIIPT